MPFVIITLCLTILLYIIVLLLFCTNFFICCVITDRAYVSFFMKSFNGNIFSLFSTNGCPLPRKKKKNERKEIYVHMLLYCSITILMSF